MIRSRLTHTTAPLQPTGAPGPSGAPRPRSRRVRERAAHNFAQLIATPLRLRGARAGRTLRGSLFDSSHPGPPAPPLQACAGRSATQEGVLEAGVVFYLQDIRRG